MRSTAQITLPLCSLGNASLNQAFSNRVNRLGHALFASGIGKNQKVATTVLNCLELLDLYWAAAETGAVVVPMSSLLQPRGLGDLLREAIHQPNHLCTKGGEPNGILIRPGELLAWRPGHIVPFVDHVHLTYHKNQALYAHDRMIKRSSLLVIFMSQFCHLAASLAP